MRMYTYAQRERERERERRTLLHHLYHRCERLLEKLRADLKIDRPDSMVVCSLKAADDVEGSKEDGEWVVVVCG